MPTSRHRYQFGMSYGLQRYEGGNAVALAAMTERRGTSARSTRPTSGGCRRASRSATARHYAHYDYCSARALQPARGGHALAVERALRVRASAARQCAAPGARGVPAAVTRAKCCRRSAPSRRCRVGRLPRGGDAALRDRPRARLDGVTLGVRAFQQRIDDQLVTVFGLRATDAEAPRSATTTSAAPATST